MSEPSAPRSDILTAGRSGPEPTSETVRRHRYTPPVVLEIPLATIELSIRERVALSVLRKPDADPR
jgi:hypothetical protein